MLRRSGSCPPLPRPRRPHDRRPSDADGENLDRKKTEDADRDGNNHALSWSAGHYSTPSGRVVEGKSCRRVNRQVCTQYLGRSSRPCSIVSGNKRISTSCDLGDRRSGLVQIASDAETCAARCKKLGEVIGIGTADGIEGDLGR